MKALVARELSGPTGLDFTDMEEPADVGDQNLVVVHYSATQIKRLLTGSGKATKDQVQRAIKNELGLDRVLEPNDVADAFAVALCHYHSSRVVGAA